MSNIYTCTACRYTTNRLWNYAKHIQTFKHLANNQRSIELNNCKMCEYTSYDKSNYNKHLLSIKHLVKDAITSYFVCNDCTKKYKHRSSLYRHKKQCIKNIIISKKEYELAMKCNKLEGKIEALKDVTSNQIINQVVHYSPTNINIYLNNNYKDAMNMKEFVDKLTLSVEDLLYTKDMGYVRGISNIFLKNLKELSLERRPIHCIKAANTKELYIKDDNSWEKDKGMLDKGITKIKKLQMKDCHKLKEESFLKMVKQVTDTNAANNNKIKHILKQNTELVLK